MHIVSVFGGNRIAAHEPGYREAMDLGNLLAGAGFAVATGGYGGVMEAACRGAREAGGRTIGVITTAFAGVKDLPNPWLDEIVNFPTLSQRLLHLVTFSDALVALRGGVGTLSEVALAWSLMQVHEMPRKPFVLVGHSWRRVMAAYQRESTILDHDLSLLSFADTPQDVLPLLSVLS